MPERMVGGAKDAQDGNVIAESDDSEVLSQTVGQVAFRLINVQRWTEKVRGPADSIIGEGSKRVGDVIEVVVGAGEESSVGEVWSSPTA